jgi:hypothetical protein
MQEIKLPLPEISERPRYFGVRELGGAYRLNATMGVLRAKSSKRFANSKAKGVTVSALGDISPKIDVIFLT